MFDFFKAVPIAKWLGVAVTVATAVTTATWWQDMVPTDVAVVVNGTLAFFTGLYNTFLGKPVDAVTLTPKEKLAVAKVQ